MPENPFADALKTVTTPHTDVGTLLRTAVSALEAEDSRLRLAFAQARHQTLKCNHGLSHRVFEQNLVYEIFKSWLPLTEVYWEHPYHPNGSDKADLVLALEGKPKVVVEAKWWMSERKKTLGAISADVKKLNSWKEDIESRLLIAFWYSQNAPDEWEKDLAAVRAFSSGFPSSIVTPIFADRFATHAEFGSDIGAYFAVCALLVTPPKM